MALLVLVHALYLAHLSMLHVEILVAFAGLRWDLTSARPPKCRLIKEVWSQPPSRAKATSAERGLFSNRLDAHTSPLWSATGLTLAVQLSRAWMNLGLVLCSQAGFCRLPLVVNVLISWPCEKSTVRTICSRTPSQSAVGHQSTLILSLKQLDVLCKSKLSSGTKSAAAAPLMDCHRLSLYLLACP